MPDPRKRIARILVKVALDGGATEVRIVRRSRHPAIIGFDRWNRRFVQTFATSPSDHRSDLNTIHQLRRRLRHVGAEQ